MQETASKCATCGGNNHRTTRCPKPAICVCQGIGHNEANCPSIKRCEQCKSFSHRSIQCPTQKCGICYGYGHVTEGCSMCRCPKCNGFGCSGCSTNTVEELGKKPCENCGTFHDANKSCRICPFCEGIGHDSTTKKGCPSFTDNGHVSLRCDNCKGIDHVRNKCPWPRCEKCNAIDHETGKCLETSTPKNECGKCGSRAHNRKACNTQRCVFCKAWGHSRTDCPRCDICLGFGHNAADCNTKDSCHLLRCLNCAHFCFLDQKCECKPCANCSGFGHSGKPCPRIRCSNCNDIGHTVCTMDANIRTKAKCEACGKRGHNQDGCRTPQCTLCRAFGHYESYCDTPSCMDCGAFGHSEKCHHSRCVKCHGIGHKDGECEPLYCKVCQGTGHLNGKCISQGDNYEGDPEQEEEEDYEGDPEQEGEENYEEDPEQKQTEVSVKGHTRGHKVKHQLLGFFMRKWQVKKYTSIDESKLSNDVLSSTVVQKNVTVAMSEREYSRAIDNMRTTAQRPNTTSCTINVFDALFAQFTPGKHSKAVSNGTVPPNGKKSYSFNAIKLQKCEIKEVIDNKIGELGLELHKYAVSYTKPKTCINLMFEFRTSSDHVIFHDGNALAKNAVVLDVHLDSGIATPDGDWVDKVKCELETFFEEANLLKTKIMNVMVETVADKKFIWRSTCCLLDCEDHPKNSSKTSQGRAK